MEKITKELKGISNFLAFLGLLQIVELLTTFKTLNQMDISALGNAEFAALGFAASTMLTIAKVMCIAPMVLGILILFYLCIKGHKEANDPSPAKFHIILAVICAVCYAFTAVETLVGAFNNSSDLLMSLLEGVIAAGTSALLFFYFAYAKKIRTRD